MYFHRNFLTPLNLASTGQANMTQLIAWWKYLWANKYNWIVSVVIAPSHHCYPHSMLIGLSCFHLVIKSLDANFNWMLNKCTNKTLKQFPTTICHSIWIELNIRTSHFHFNFDKFYSFQWQMFWVTSCHRPSIGLVSNC